VEAKLDGAGITDVSLVHIVQYNTITSLWLIRINITPDGVSQIAQLPNLTDLVLWDTAVSDDNFLDFANMPSLERLDLFGASASRIEAIDRFRLLRLDVKCNKHDSQRAGRSSVRGIE
jgi:hypothetical protein